MILHVMAWHWVWGFRGWDVARTLNCLVNAIGGCALQVDLFFYREPDEGKDRDEEEAGAAEFAAVEYPAPALGMVGDAQWGPEAAEAGQWEADASAVATGAVPAGVPAVEWTGAAVPAGAGWDVGAAPAAAPPAGWETAAPAAPAGWEPAPQ